MNWFIVALPSLVVGAILTLLIQRILNKSGLFTYFVSHYQVGVSAEDAVFGKVQVTWDNLPVANLYFSSVELRNESLKDYENVVVKVLTSTTSLLSERTEIVGTHRVAVCRFSEFARIPWSRAERVGAGSFDSFAYATVDRSGNTWKGLFVDVGRVGR